MYMKQARIGRKESGTMYCHSPDGSNHPSSASSIYYDPWHHPYL